MSACPKCDRGTTFKLSTKSPKDSAFKLSFIECSSCGAVVGVMDFHNIGQMLNQQNKALKKIAAAVGVSVTLD